MKLQSEHLQVQSLAWEPVRHEKVASESQKPKPTEAIAGVSDVASSLKALLPTDISANKQAMVNRLITRCFEGSTKS